MSKFLGSGGFGRVVRRYIRGKYYAVKSPIDENELAIMKTLIGESNMVCVYGKYIDNINPEKSGIVMEYCFDGTLDTFISNYSTTNQNLLTEIYKSSLISYIKQLGNMLEFLHRRNIVHCDIKPQNILMCGGVLKLGDFGLAHPITQHLHRGKRGTSQFISPEMQTRRIYNINTDIYSMGRTLCLLVFGSLTRPPKHNHLVDTIGFGKRLRVIIGYMIAGSKVIPDQIISKRKTHQEIVIYINKLKYFPTIKC